MAEAKKCGGCSNGASAQQVQAKSLEQHYIEVVKNKSDINEHLMVLKQLVAENPRIVEMGTRYAHSTTAFLYGKPKLLHTYDLKKSSQAENLKRYVDDKQCDYQCIVGDSTEVNIVECDLLFLDTDPHTADRVYKELSKHHKKVKNYIVFHDTEIFGEKYGNEPGVLPAIRRFIKENPEWFTFKHYSNNNGLTILSKLDKDRPPELPSLLKQAYNFGKAKIKLTLSGEGYLPDEKAEERHNICKSNGGSCPLNKRKIDTDQCTKCGCPLKETPDGRKGKVYYPTESCPFGLWGPVTKDEVEEIVNLTEQDEVK